MMKLFIVLAAGIASAATAQTTLGEGTMRSPNYSTYQSSLEGLAGQGSSETPTMRAAKLEKAKALRVEAQALLNQDGGKFTPEHEAYIRGKACDILGARRVGIGSLVPRRRCG